MKSNVSNLDRIIRFLLAIAVGVLYYMDIISGTVAIILGVVAVIFFVTSLINFCPLYKALGISTRRKTA
jgi:hypothetical protein